MSLLKRSLFLTICVSLAGCGTSSTKVCEVPAQPVIPGQLTLPLHSLKEAETDEEVGKVYKDNMIKAGICYSQYNALVHAVRMREAIDAE